MKPCYSIQNFTANSIDELVKIALHVKKMDEDNILYFRGESKDRGEKALSPSIYRNNNLEKEEYFYREMQRFNDQEFRYDRTTFDKLSRIQHYSAPTRMIDMSEDLLSATYFALKNKKDEKQNKIVYIIEIDKNKIKYYDSDSVSVVSNLAKIPLKGDGLKTKKQLHGYAKDSLNNIDNFNKHRSVKFLLHEIKEEKPQFENIINPKHLFSIYCVKPKYSNRRVIGQKGAFLLFGMNINYYDKPINLLVEYGKDIQINSNLDKFHPIKKITKIILKPNIKKSDLDKLGIIKPYIYPELNEVSSWLNNG